MENLEFMKKFRPEELCIKEFKYWLVCVRQKQPTLGDVVILLKRETENVSGMLPEEGAEFPKVIKWYEELCREKLEQLKQCANDYEQANKIRIFIDEFSKRKNLTEEQKHWIEWARLKADWLDPLVECKDEILDEKLESPNRSWWY